MRTKPFPGSAAKGVNRALGARSRMRRKALRDQVALQSAAVTERRNDLLPALEQTRRPLSSLKPPARNVRKAEPAHIAEVAKSIARFGVTKPVLIDGELRVVDGWVVVEAARALGLTEAPCLVVGHLAPEELRLLRIALNRLQEKGIWDLDALKQEFEALLELEMPLEATAFEAPEIDLVLASDDTSLDAKANAAPEINASKAAVSRPGDLWLLDRHRIPCGDACSAASYTTLMAGSQACAISADPPYNIAIDGFAVGKGTTRHREFVQASGEMTPEQFEAFLFDFLNAAAAHAVDGGLLFACMDWRHISDLVLAGRKAGLTVINIIVWAKASGGLDGLYRSAYELIALFKKGTAKHQDNVLLGKHGRDRTNIWHYPGAGSPGSSAREQLAIHPTAKPVELVADALLDVTQRDDVVLDPFLGSGTTIIAAEKARRVAYGLELDPHYVDAAVRRWQVYTGREARHAESGKSFAELAEARAAQEAQAETPKLTSSAIDTTPVPQPDGPEGATLRSADATSSRSDTGSGSC